MKADLKTKLDEVKNSYERKQDDIKKKKDKKKKQRIFTAAAGVVLVIACIGYASVMGSSDQESKQTSTDYISADNESDDAALMEEETTSVAEVKQQLAGSDTTSNGNGKTDSSQLGDESNPLTTENCPDFERILALMSDETNQFIEFSDKYYGQVISFDGYISDSMPSSDRFHDRYKYYNDWLVSTGDYVDETYVSPGPIFKMEYVGRPDFIDESEAAAASTGSNIKVTARVGKFDESAQVLLLDQLEIELR